MQLCRKLLPSPRIPPKDNFAIVQIVWIFQCVLIHNEFKEFCLMHISFFFRKNVFSSYLILNFSQNLMLISFCLTWNWVSTLMGNINKYGRGCSLFKIFAYSDIRTRFENFCFITKWSRIKHSFNTRHTTFLGFA